MASTLNCWFQVAAVTGCSVRPCQSPPAAAKLSASRTADDLSRGDPADARFPFWTEMRPGNAAGLSVPRHQTDDRARGPR